MTLQEEELKNVCNMGLLHRILYATTNYDFYKENNLESYYGSSFNEECINEFANRLSKFKNIRLIFLDELTKLQWGENFS